MYLGMDKTLFNIDELKQYFYKFAKKHIFLT